MPPKSIGASSHKNVPPKGKQSDNSREKTKPVPKQPLPVPERLKRLFTSLCAQIDGGHFANAVKTCDKVLRLAPQDKDALQTKLFLLLQTEQYDTALSLINEDSAFAGYEYEKAYSLYRLQRESEATEALNTVKARDDAESRGVLHLEAQLAYRQGSYQAAFELYNQLLDTAESQSEEQSDILTNLDAAQKHLDFINTEFLHALDSLPTSTSSGLETASPPQPANSLSAAIAADAAATAHTEPGATKEPRKVRIKRVPKAVILGVTPPPDPERWLKKTERSTFAQGKRRRGAGGGATQGSMESAGVHQSGKAGGGTTHGKGKKKK